MLRKSSKKKFNFYEEYKILGSTFDYSFYFKQLYFFDYWLKHTLKQISLVPVDIFYSKTLTALNVFCIVNKKYLLTSAEAYSLAKKKKNKIGFTLLKFYTILRWLKRRKHLFYVKFSRYLKYGRKYYALRRFFYRVLFSQPSYFVFFRAICYRYIKYIYFLLLFFTKLSIRISPLKTRTYWLSVFQLILKNLKIFKLKKILHYLLRVYQLVYDSLWTKFFIFSYDKRYFVSQFLLQINRLRWYSIKVALISLLQSKNFFPIKFSFLNMNDLSFYKTNLNKLAIIKRKKKILSMNLNSKKILTIRYYLLPVLYKKFLMQYYKIQKFWLNITFLNCQNWNFLSSRIWSRPVGVISKILLVYLFNFFTYCQKIKYFFYNYLITQLKVLLYYITNMNYYCFLAQNLLWTQQLKNFYKDLKKNCMYFTTQNFYFKNLVLAIFFSFIFEKPDIFTSVLAKGFSKTRKHHFFLNNVVDIINMALKFIRKYKKISLKSVTIRMRGKFNGKLKRSRRNMTIGEKIKLQNLSSKIKYSYKEAYTFAGTFGIKVWYSF